MPSGWTAGAASAGAALRSAVDPRTRRGQLLLALLAVAVTVSVLALVLTEKQPRPIAAPAVTSSGPGTSTPGSSTPATGSAHPKKPFACSRTSGHDGSSAPVRICVPGIHVDATVMKLGLNKDQTVEVPPLSRVGDAGWYKYSAAPGAVGPTVVLGHVDSAQYGAGIFYRLSRLHAGDTVIVSRGDGKTATFVIDRVQQVSKSKFPSGEVYGPTSGPALRLVTCGGRFDPAHGRYLDNVIAYGTLQSLRS